MQLHMENQQYQSQKIISLPDPKNQLMYTYIIHASEKKTRQLSCPLFNRRTKQYISINILKRKPNQNFYQTHYNLIQRTPVLISTQIKTQKVIKGGFQCGLWWTDHLEFVGDYSNQWGLKVLSSHLNWGARQDSFDPLLNTR